MLQDGFVLVISARGAEARRDFQRVQSARIGLPVRFVDAMIPSDVDPRRLDCLSRSWLRKLRPTEVCCLLSHREVWRIVAEEGRVRLILEDDAVMAADIVPLLDELIQVQGTGYINLETFCRKKTLARATRPVGSTGYRLARLHRDRGGAAGYLLWPDAARRLLRYTEDRAPLADSAIDLALGVDRMQVEPAPIIQAMYLDTTPDGVFGSQIAGSDRPKAGGPLAWTRYKLRRLMISIGLFFRLLPCLGRVSKREVAFAGKASAGVGSPL